MLKSKSLQTFSHFISIVLGLYPNFWWKSQAPNWAPAIAFEAPAVSRSCACPSYRARRSGCGNDPRAWTRSSWIRCLGAQPGVVMGMRGAGGTSTWTWDGKSHLGEFWEQLKPRIADPSQFVSGDVWPRGPRGPRV